MASLHANTPRRLTHVSLFDWSASDSLVGELTTPRRNAFMTPPSWEVSCWNCFREPAIFFIAACSSLTWLPPLLPATFAIALAALIAIVWAMLLAASVAPCWCSTTLQLHRSALASGAGQRPNQVHARLRVVDLEGSERDGQEV